MMRKLFMSSIFIICILMQAEIAAADPVLHFSDITSGPKTGIDDDLGSGVIVTIWGNGLGSTQGTSNVYVGNVPAAHVYYWGNATPQAGHPADLYAYHKMQVIMFSVPSGALDGVNTIKVTIGGINSNTIPFTIRTGNIKHIKITGTDTEGCGSWASPCRSMQFLTTGGRAVAGDIIYINNGVQDTDGLAVKYIKGTESNPISMIAYPRASILVQGPSGWGIGNHNGDSDYWNFSKFVVQTSGTGIGGFKGMRAVGNEITNVPGMCANGQGGAIAASASNGKDRASGLRLLGNYIHDFGCDTTSKLHHVFYITNRGGVPIATFELAWNYLTDNKAHHGLHLFDEGICGDLTGTLRVHDNVVKNQVGVGVGVATGGTDPCFTMPIEIYNNLFINVGQEISSCSGHTTAFSLVQLYNRSHVKVYNNTFYGFGIPGSGQLMYVLTGDYWQSFGGTWEWVNNIAIDTNNLTWEDATYPTKTPTVHSNNLWHSIPNPSKIPPLWDSDSLNVNPLYIAPEIGNFNLQVNSPVISNGTSVVSSVVKRDLFGGWRPTPLSIGAVEYSYSAPDIIGPDATFQKPLQISTTP